MPERTVALTERSGFPGWPVFDEEAIEAVTAVLRSGRVNRWTGEENERFEAEFAASVDRRYAVAVANGTVALELALHALGIGVGDEVVVSSRTFIATASAVVMRGAVPVIADVDPDSQNLTAETVAAVLSPRTRAIIAVHFNGWPCEMDDLAELARDRMLFLIEDCAQAQGATYHGRPVGSLGDVAAFSFCQDKLMTTGGEGGMLVTNNRDFWGRAWSFKDHGKNLHARRKISGFGKFRWVHDSFGTNWRMTEMQAALGRVGLRRLPGWLAIRRRHAGRLQDTLSHQAALRVADPPGYIGHAHYKFYAFLRREELDSGTDRDTILAEVNAAGVPCFSGSCSEIYLEKAFRRAGFGPPRRLAAARVLGETSLMVNVHPTLRDEDIRLTCNVLAGVLAKHTRWREQAQVQHMLPSPGPALAIRPKGDKVNYL